MMCCKERNFFTIEDYLQKVKVAVMGINVLLTSRIWACEAADAVLGLNLFAFSQLHLLSGSACKRIAGSRWPYITCKTHENQHISSPQNLKYSFPFALYTVVPQM